MGLEQVVFLFLGGEVNRFIILGLVLFVCGVRKPDA